MMKPVENRKPFGRRSLLVCLLLLTFWNAAAAQDGGATAAARANEKPLLSVGGEVARPVRLTAAEWAKLPRLSVRAKDHDGKETEFEGVELAEVLRLAGVKLGGHMHGKELANYLVVEAADGYKVVFALPELDSASVGRVVLLADRSGGKPLAADEGPLRIVIGGGDKQQGRWARQVVSLVVRKS
ncbi:MAG TPA: molybdopterin-dependent oxidoreductase [Pyrinomonadaceae bacterium]|nr:molybdopterin-dependent oxidoreductase [Pyrinomonadaceae bacterium]